MAQTVEEKEERVFVADPKFVDVRAELLRRGWTENTSRQSPAFHLKVSQPVIDSFRPSRRDGIEQSTN